MIVIGITGKAGAGKDAVAEILRDQHGFAIISYARPIKQMLCAVLDEPIEKWEDREWRNAPLRNFGGKTPRQLAQTLGTEWGRECVSENLWRDLAHDMIGSYGLNQWVISDVRFNNEAEEIRRRGGFILRVYRPDVDGGAIGHSSENGIDWNWGDLNIFNDGSMEDLAREVAHALELFVREEAA